MSRIDTLLTLDFETYYSQSYSLSRMTTEAYIRHPEFHAQMVGLKHNDQPTYVVPHEDIPTAFAKINWARTGVLCHNAHFDGLILSHHYKVKPRMFFDTLSMARAIRCDDVGNSLKKLAQQYGLGAKGDELASALGIKHLPPELYEKLAGYCANDVELTYALFMKLRPMFPKREYDVVDFVIKTFTRPTLELDAIELTAFIKDEQERKAKMLDHVAAKLGVSPEETRDMVMSNAQFAGLLDAAGVEVPMKVSNATGKPMPALAKTDKGMTDLLDHPDELVSDLVALRLGTKSTINESRALRMLEMGERGPACVYLKYSGAKQTHRLSGGDKMNWQNFPARDGKARLRHAIRAPRGTRMVAVDSSNIELRVNMTLAGQLDAVAALRSGQDLYCEFATRYYGRNITKADKTERNFGKASLLGLGYGMGPDKFQFAAQAMYGVKLDAQQSERGVKMYRSTYPSVPRWWWAWNDIIPTLAAGHTAAMHDIGLRVEKGCICLDGFLPLRYPDLREINGEWSISGRANRSRVYGAKLVENLTQWVARNIVMGQTVEIAKRYPVVMSVHDEVVFLCRDGEHEDALAWAVEIMSRSPDWFPQVPLAAEGHAEYTYGECK